MKKWKMNLAGKIALEMLCRTPKGLREIADEFSTSVQYVEKTRRDFFGSAENVQMLRHALNLASTDKDFVNFNATPGYCPILLERASADRRACKAYSEREEESASSFKRRRDAVIDRVSKSRVATRDEKRIAMMTLMQFNLSVPWDAMITIDEIR